MKIAGEVLVSDILGELGLTEVPDGCNHALDQRIVFDDVLIDDDNVREEWPTIARDGDFDGLADRVDERDLADLACAIRCGDRVESELLLDRIFDDSSTLTSQIQIGRYRLKARQAA